jgi:metal-sulfur cluster biosynthetic enzyme
MSQVARSMSDHEAEVWAALDLVCDPELDESITDLGFVEQLDIHGDGSVDVLFRLPTYWCSPNFAYLMASDIYLSVGQLDWVSQVRPTLRDHLFEEQLNVGVAQGQSFRQIFGDDADADIDEVRGKFRLKAFQRRQEVVLRALLAEGIDAADIVAMTASDLEYRPLSDQDAEIQRLRYLSILPAIYFHGPFPCREFAPVGQTIAAKAPAFVDDEARLLTVAGLTERLQMLRSVRLNMEFTGTICRSLLAVRDKAAEVPGSSNTGKLED